MESLSLEWDIDFLAGDDINRVFLSHDEEHRELTRVPTGVVYRFMATSSRFQIMSTMTTNTSTDLSGARVSCSGRSRHPQSSAVMTTLDLPGKSTKIEALRLCGCRKNVS